MHNTNRQDHLPALGKNIADKANHDGVAERFADPAVPKRIAVALSRIDDDDHLRRDGALSILKAAQHHAAHTRYRLRTVPGIGKSRSRVLWYAIPAIDRFPPVQACAASGRLVKWAKASAGKRSGTSGTKSGQAHLPWAFSEAAGLCLREKPEGQKFLVSLETKHGTGKALTIFAHTWARAVSDR